MSEGPVLNQFNLVVDDMAASVEFYRLLGLTIPETDSEWNSHHRTATMPGDVVLDFDTPQAARIWDHGWPERGEMGVLGFKVSESDEVDRIYEKLTGAGYSGQQAPYDTFWGARYAVVEDPDGRAVGIMGPVDPARRSPPPPAP